MIKKAIWKYDLFKTTQDFRNDLKGVERELNDASSMKEGSAPWLHKI